MRHHAPRALPRNNLRREIHDNRDYPCEFRMQVSLRSSRVCFSVTFLRRFSSPSVPFVPFQPADSYIPFGFCWYFHNFPTSPLLRYFSLYSLVWHRMQRKMGRKKSIFSSTKCIRNVRTREAANNLFVLLPLALSIALKTIYFHFPSSTFIFTLSI